ELRSVPLRSNGGYGPLGQNASIDHHGMPDHETCARTAQPQDGRGDLFRLAEAANWFGSYEGFDNVGVVVLRDPCRHRCVANDAWAHRVDPDTGVGIVERCSASEADDT